MRAGITVFSHIDRVVGLGFAVVARIIERLGGQLRVDSRIGDGPHFASYCRSLWPTQMRSIRKVSQLTVRTMEASVGNSEIDGLLSAIPTSRMVPHAPSTSPRPAPRQPRPRNVRLPSEGTFEVEALCYHSTQTYDRLSIRYPSDQVPPTQYPNIWQ